ncbi:Ig-like domain-containing protein [Paenibacillus allorhizosphaerae]|uniref:Pectate lyase n=1 Tax=Paenibacillus allorhizosphaerae TaxID=2849866 RepID=A0ABM8VK70_9BACL|nr:Ig-like domain-containing protein [Paenibacillus allorhizosphaerae]CAG7646571.1 hypothetical protein PAECIP111802_03780 [Paenibacillus allorhizosphaerae]
MKSIKQRIIVCCIFAAIAAVTAVSLIQDRRSQAGGEPEAVPERLPAFPGAEGAGMYTTGSRGGEVYEVTTLRDGGPGSLRDAVSKGNRTVVFRVSGTIELVGPLSIKGSNLTIAGQTAPGDGITIAKYETNIDADNVMIRYLRFRLGDTSKREADAFGGRGRRDIVIDHCSTSWAVDEVLSAYAIRNLTVQWSLLGESLTMSVHQKGAHGYGGIWGGQNVTFHHNLIVHNSSRNPRFPGETPVKDNLIDFRNNVIYNWGFKASYGGENARVNAVGNYYKWGPDTRERAKQFMLDPAGPGGQWYVAGNYIDGFPEGTANNWNAVSGADASMVKLTQPIPFEHEVKTQTADEAYETVLQQAGAIVPRRDAVDARLVADVRNRTGRQINSQAEVGGFRKSEPAEAPLDSDHDGMPDSWEKAQRLDSNNPDDRNRIGKGGYTMLENYLNSIAGNVANPSVVLTSPKVNTIYGGNADIAIEADVKPVSGAKIRKVEFYDNDVKLGESAAAPYRFTWKAVPDGTHFLSAYVVDDKGMAAQSTAVPVHVNKATDLEGWHTADIGQPGIQGFASLREGRFTLKSAGKLEGKSDAFRFVYRTMEGDGDIIAKVEAITAVAEGTGAGVMIRAGLEPEAAAAMMRISYIKSGTGGAFAARTTAAADLKSMESKDGTFPYWVKLSRRWETVTGYMSHDGQEWKPYGTADVKLGGTVYVGLAADAVKTSNQIDNYTVATLSNVSIVNK